MKHPLPSLPPSLAARPPKPFELQTIPELELERDYWAAMVRSAAGPAGAKHADECRKGCEAWISRKIADLS